MVVSVPHYGTAPMPHIHLDDYREARFATFAYGFADTFAPDLYGDLYKAGATVLATPVSRMFVDLNRRRDDFEEHEGEVRSRRGVVRTHTMRDVPIFARPLAPADLETRLQTLYDPYYSTLDDLLAERRRQYGFALLLDGHTGSPRRMGDHQIIIGTRHAATCARELVVVAAAVFTRHGFVAHENVAGYTGGNIVATYGQPDALRTHAMQIEVNAGLLVTSAADDVVTRITRGEIPDKAEPTIARLRACLEELVGSLPSVLAALHAPSR